MSDAQSNPGEEAGHTSAMIALHPAEPITVADGLPGALGLDDQHLTLVYLGKVDSLTPEALAVADEAAAAAAAVGPIEAHVSGVGTLGDEGAVVLYVQDERIGDAHEAAIGELWDYGSESYAEQHPSFLPHVTLGYGDSPESQMALIEAGLTLVGASVAFDRVDLHVGGEITEHPLSAADEPDDPTEETDDMTPTPLRFASPDQVTEGVRVTWLEGEGEDQVQRVGTVVELMGSGADDDPWMVVVAPDDGPDDARVDVPLDSVEPVEGAEVAPVPEDMVASAGATTFAEVAIEPGVAVEWDDEEVGVRSGVVVGLDNLDTSGDAPQGTVTVAPDDDPENPVEIGVALVRAKPADDAPPAGDAMPFRSLLVVEETESGDYRIISENALSWRPLPLPLYAMFRNPDGGDGHAAAVIVGRIDSIWRDETNPRELWGEGFYNDDEDGRRAYDLMRSKSMRGVSVDLDSVQIEWEGAAGPEEDPVVVVDDSGRMRVTRGRIMGATQCGFPAFAEAYIEVSDAALVASSGIELRVWTPVDDHGALVASADAYPERPPAEWFAEPDRSVEMTPVRVDPDGRVHGFAAQEGKCHIGFADRCVQVPKSSCGYAEWRKGQVLTAEGTLVATGPVVYDTVHPDLLLSASDAAAFYAHSGCVVADCVAYDIPGKGVYLAGAVRPGASPEGVRALRGGDISPDWRHVSGRRGLEAVAMLVVNNSGFKVDGALAASAGAGAIIPGTAPRGVIDLTTGEVTAMVAAGRVRADYQSDTDLAVAALRSELVELRAALRPLRAERARRLQVELASRADTT